MTTPCPQCVRLPGRPDAIQCPNCRSRTRGRDEPSTLFSLSALSTVATDAAHRVTAARGEGSGLIDIRAMNAGFGGRGHEATLPGFGGLAPALPELSGPGPVTRSHASVGGSQLPLYGLAVALALGLASLAAHVLTRAPPPVVRSELPARVVAVAEQPVAEQPEPVVEEAAVVAPAELPGTTASPPEPRRRGPKSAVVRPVEPTPDAPVASVTPAPPAVEPDDSVDCLLGRKQCGAQRPTPAEPAPAPAPASELPAMLEQPDISALTNAGRAAATEACGSLAADGERVKLRLSISGPTGTIVGIRTVDDAGNPKLAACATEAVRKLAVRKVQKPQIGAVVTLKF